jgi:membrane associated rhomboid family serine protease/Zn-finger nucleic acid-binding protein
MNRGSDEARFDRGGGVARSGGFTRSETDLERRCPRDGHPLRQRDVRGVEVDVCLECDGVFLDEGELESLSEGQGGVSKRAAREAATDFGGRVPHAYAAYRCPACRSDLLPRFYGHGRQRHELYLCRGCRGMWLDVRALRRLDISVAPAAVIAGAVDDPSDDLLESDWETIDTDRVPPPLPASVVPSTGVPASPDDTSTIGVSFPRSPREWFVALTGFPIDVGNPCTIFPWATWTLIVANVAVFCAQLLGNSTEAELVYRFGLDPNELRAGEWYRLLTSMFLHGDIFHLLGNLFFLYTFGDNLEERYGRLRYLFLYVVCGVVAGLLSAASAWVGDENTIRIGASGAISGILGTYLVTYPRTRILVGSLFFRFLPLVIRAPVWGFVVFWAGFNVLGWFAQRDAEFYAVDYVAHLGGFAVGLVGGAVLAALYRSERSEPHVALRP